MRDISRFYFPAPATSFAALLAMATLQLLTCEAAEPGSITPRPTGKIERLERRFDAIVAADAKSNRWPKVSFRKEKGTVYGSSARRLRLSKLTCAKDVDRSCGEDGSSHVATVALRRGRPGPQVLPKALAASAMARPAC